jgi:hypothetical protein
MLRLPLANRQATQERPAAEAVRAMQEKEGLP